MTFQEFNLKPWLIDNLKAINFFQPTEIQKIVISKLLKKEQTIVKSATGTGKTHAFLIPLLETLDERKQNVQKIIISPTRELAEQIFVEVQKLIINRSIDCRIYVGGTDRGQEIKRLEKNQPQIVIGTIGKIIDLAITTNVLKIHTADFIAIDEADMVFADNCFTEIDSIFTKLNSNILISVFSATISAELVIFLNKYLSKCQLIDLSNLNLIKSEINHIFIPTKNKDKMEILLKLINSFEPYLVLIFANTKVKVDEIASFLASNNIKVGKLTGDLEARERKQILKRIKDGNYKYIVASDIASRGLDIEGVSHVINFELPNEIEFFIHRVGRTARYYSDGAAYSLYNFSEDYYVDRLRSKGLKCSYMVFKGGEFIQILKRDLLKKPKAILEIEEQLHMKTPLSKKVKPAYKKKRKIEIQKKLRKMKRQRIDDLYHKKEHKAK